jgi:4'-phosphopantetheinyl transferase
MRALARLRAPPPRADEVQVWRVALDRPLAAPTELAAVLAPDERARADRFCRDEDRARFVVARALLRLILGLHMGADPASLAFRTGPHGKPALAGPAGGTLRFNVAHAGGLALCALAPGREVGVDLEPVRPVDDADALLRRLAAPAEAAAYAALPPAARRSAFFRWWTRKEAFLKATGEGLSRPLTSFEVSLRPDEPARLIRVAGDPAETARWRLRALAPAPGYVGALAAEGYAWRPRVLDA